MNAIRSFDFPELTYPQQDTWFIASCLLHGRNFPAKSSLALRSVTLQPMGPTSGCQLTWLGKRHQQAQESGGLSPYFLDPAADLCGGTKEHPGEGLGEAQFQASTWVAVLGSPAGSSTSLTLLPCPSP